MPEYTASKKFAAEARRQSLLLRDDRQEKEIMDWIEEVSDTGNEADPESSNAERDSKVNDPVPEGGGF